MQYYSIFMKIFKLLSEKYWEMVNEFEGFAHFYFRTSLGEFSTKLAEEFPELLAEFDANPDSILDLACGDGRFVSAMADRGHEVVGVDRSQEMVRRSRERKDHDGSFEIRRGDMRDLDFDRQFDAVTCWYNSVNYLLEVDDLRACFRAVAEVLRDGGIFVFDADTRYHLAENATRHPSYVGPDEDDVFAVNHGVEYDYETDVLTVEITGFKRTDDGWRRIEEVHKERAYRLAEIESYLEDAGLVVEARFGDLANREPATADSSRVWFVASRASE